MPPPPDNDSDVDIIMDEEEQELLEVPDWVQKACQKSVNERKNNIRLIIQRENALKKLHEHKANGTSPKSIVPSIKLHVSEKYQKDVDEFLDEINKEYSKKITDKLIEIREKELMDANKMKKETFNGIRTEIDTTMVQLRKRNGYEGNVRNYERDRKGYLNIFRLEAMNSEKEIRRTDYFREKNKAEVQDKKRAEQAEKQANNEMTDPIQKELQKIKDQLQKIQNKYTGKFRPKHKVHHPKGNGRRGYYQPPRLPQNFWIPPYRNYNNYRNNGRRNYHENWRNPNWRNNPNRQPRIPQNQGSEEENGNRRPRRRYTNSTNRLESGQPNYRPRRN